MHAAGIAERHAVCGNVFRNDAARADHGVVAYAHARHDDDARAQPHVVADTHGQVILRGLSAYVGAHGVICRGEHRVRADHHVVADIDMRVVHERQVEVCVKIVADMGVFSPVRAEGRLDIAVFADFGKFP